MIGQLSIVQQLAVWVVPVLLAITVHEVSHGFVARYYGDTTAYMLGRLTLNPVKHIDPLGTILVPAIMLLLPGSFVFGWAKPVPVSFNNLRNPLRDMGVVAAAGPLSNLTMAFLWALLARLSMGLLKDGYLFFEPLLLMSIAGIYINIILMVLNLLPLPPLDGGRVLAGVLPSRMAMKFSRIEPYGFMILIALLVTGALGWILFPLISLVLFVVLPVSGFAPQGFWQIIQILIQ